MASAQPQQEEESKKEWTIKEVESDEVKKIIDELNKGVGERNAYLERINKENEDFNSKMENYMDELIKKMEEIKLDEIEKHENKLKQNIIGKINVYFGMIWSREYTFKDFYNEYKKAMKVSGKKAMKVSGKKAIESEPQYMHGYSIALQLYPRQCELEKGPYIKIKFIFCDGKYDNYVKQQQSIEKTIFFSIVRWDNCGLFATRNTDVNLKNRSSGMLDLCPCSDVIREKKIKGNKDLEFEKSKYLLKDDTLKIKVWMKE